MAQRKYIIIGEAWLEVVFSASGATNATTNPSAKASYPGGPLLHVAETLASKSVQTILLTEIGNDMPGRQIADHVKQHGVDLSFADQYSMTTPVVLRYPDIVERYDMPAHADGFDITWPRIEEEDVIVFGGFPAVDDRIHERLNSFLANCHERKATIIYIPGVDDPRLRQITLVMPRVFENLELADVVIALPGDLRKLYGYDDAQRAYKNNISFYCPRVAALSQSEDGKIDEVSFGDVPVSGKITLPEIIADILLQLPMPETKK